jgi:ADP-ribose pyrophosphatase YjhB (NUDIX family)
MQGVRQLEGNVMVARQVRVSAKAIVVQGGRILLVRNRDADGEWYCLPGGGQAHGETIPHALKRECLEEVGCQVTVGRLLFVRDYIAEHHEFAEQDLGAHQVELMFECKLAPGCAPALGEGPDGMQTGVAWVELAALARSRFYPRALGELLAAGIPTEGARYLGDVN